MTAQLIENIPVSYLRHHFQKNKNKKNKSLKNKTYFIQLSLSAFFFPFFEGDIAGIAW